MYAVGFILLMILVGGYANTFLKDSKDFFVAGHRQSSGRVSMSLVATILGSSSVIGGIDLATTSGWSAVWFLFSGIIGMMCLLPLAKYVRRYAKYTLPEMLKDWYGEEIYQLSSIIIAISWTGIIAAQIIGAANVFQIMLGISYPISVGLATFIIILYTVLGGQLSIIHTDVIQAILIILGITGLSFWLGYYEAIPLWQQGLPSFPFHEEFTFLDFWVILLTYGITFTVGADIYSRLFCTKDERAAERAVGLTILILPLVGLSLTYIGVAIHTIYPASPWGNGSSFIYFVGNHFSPYIGGLSLVIILSAVLSSADTTLLTASAIISGLLGQDLRQLSSLRVTRWIIVAVGLLSAVIAILLPSIIQALLLGLTVFSGACIVPTLLGLLGYRFNPIKIRWAIISGGMLALSGKLLGIFWGYGNMGNTIIISAFVVNFLVLWLMPAKTTS